MQHAVHRPLSTLFALLVSLLSALPLPAAVDLPVLRANSTTVDVQDGPRLFKAIWNIDSSLPLDTYNAARSDKPKTITFISDIDRLSFDVEPNKTYDFIVLLNGKTRCPTRISTMVQPFKRTDPASASQPIEIPFTLDRGIMMIKIRVNGSEPIDVLFDTGADATLIHSSAVEKGVSVKLDGTQGHTGFGGGTVSQSASTNTIELPGIRWDNEPIIWGEHQSFGGNGILGSHVFEDKIVEVDFDRQLLRIHQTLPANAATFTRLPMYGAGRTFAIDTTLAGGRQSGTGKAFFDTGFPGALLAYAELDRSLGLRGNLSRIGRSRTSGTGRGAVDCDILVLPSLAVAGTELRKLPIHVEDPAAGPGSGYSGAVVGMDVIKRFNLILDYPRDTLYLAPNTLAASPYSIVVPGPPVAAIAAISIASLGILIVGGLWLRGRILRPAA